MFSESIVWLPSLFSYSTMNGRGDLRSCISRVFMNRLKNVLRSDGPRYVILL